MFVVINVCYGGFGLSNEAILELIKMKSTTISTMLIKEYYGGNNPTSKDHWQEKWERDKKAMKKIDKYFISTFGSGQLFDDDYNNYSSVYSFNGDRTHPDLIQVVKRLGDKANGHCAELKIVKIPDDVEYEISEYDGNETIEEVHRSWS